MMNEQPATPNTLVEAIRHFDDELTCIEYVAQLRWPDGIVCPKCNGTKGATFISTRKVFKCRVCRKQFSVKVGTIFEDSPIKLSKWLAAIWLMVNAKNGISSYEIHRALGVTQKTAWYMDHRIRLAMQTRTFSKLGGEVEIDETYIGGKARNMHVDKRKKLKGRGPAGKVIAMGLLERGGRVRTLIVKDTKKDTLQKEVRENVESGSEVFTDQLASYEGLNKEYVHETINHAVQYVRGNVHTNCMENFWSLLKRCVRGTWVSVEPWHLQKYLDEEAFRFNERGLTDGERFHGVVENVAGKRLTYRKLTGNAAAA